MAKGPMDSMQPTIAATECQGTGCFLLTCVCRPQPLRAVFARVIETAFRRSNGGRKCRTAGSSFFTSS